MRQKDEQMARQYRMKRPCHSIVLPTTPHNSNLQLCLGLAARLPHNAALNLLLQNFHLLLEDFALSGRALLSALAKLVGRQINDGRYQSPAQRQTEDQAPEDEPVRVHLQQRGQRIAPVLGEEKKKKANRRGGEKLP